MMNITIIPITVNPSCDCKTPSVQYEAERHLKNHPPITYWGIYLDDKHISFVSSKEQAEETKLWMEKWLERKN